MGEITAGRGRLGEENVTGGKQTMTKKRRSSGEELIDTVPIELGEVYLYVHVKRSGSVDILYI